MFYQRWYGIPGSTCMVGGGVMLASPWIDDVETTKSGGWMRCDLVARFCRCWCGNLFGYVMHSSWITPPLLGNQHVFVPKRTMCVCPDTYIPCLCCERDNKRLVQLHREATQRFAEQRFAAARHSAQQKNGTVVAVMCHQQHHQ